MSERPRIFSRPRVEWRRRESNPAPATGASAGRPKTRGRLVGVMKNDRVGQPNEKLRRANPVLADAVPVEAYPARAGLPPPARRGTFLSMFCAHGGTSIGASMRPCWLGGRRSIVQPESIIPRIGGRPPRRAGISASPSAPASAGPHDGSAPTGARTGTAARSAARIGTEVAAAGTPRGGPRRRPDAAASSRPDVATSSSPVPADVPPDGVIAVDAANAGGPGGPIPRAGAAPYCPSRPRRHASPGLRGMAERSAPRAGYWGPAARDRHRQMGRPARPRRSAAAIRPSPPARRPWGARQGSGAAVARMPGRGESRPDGPPSWPRPGAVDPPPTIRPGRGMPRVPDVLPLQACRAPRPGVSVGGPGREAKS